MNERSEWKSGVRAILNRPNFRSALRAALLLPVLVWEMLRGKDYYRAHGHFSLAPIMLALTFAAMAVASLLYWLVWAVQRRMDR